MDHKSKTSVRTLTVLALLTAMSIIFARVFTISTGFVRFNLGALPVLLAAAIAVPLVTDHSFAPLAAAAGYGLAVWYGFRQLDGMSGDISGFGLTLGELAGAAVLCLVR